MKRSILFSMFVFSAQILVAQNSFDVIHRGRYLIIREGDNHENNQNYRISGLKNLEKAELLFGTKYFAIKKFGQMSRTYFTEIVYDDGLTLYIPEDTNLVVNFHIKGGHYKMILENGREVRAGMQWYEIKSLFPVSWANRHALKRERNKPGWICFPVFFTFTRDGKDNIEDSWITFILSGENGILEEFYSYEP